MLSSVAQCVLPGDVDAEWKIISGNLSSPEVMNYCVKVKEDFLAV